MENFTEQFVCLFSRMMQFQDFSRVFQDLCLLPGLSRPGSRNVLIPGLSTVCTNPGSMACKSIKITQNTTQYYFK